MARRNQKPPKEITNHPFLQFPRSLNPATLTKHQERLSTLLGKRIDIAPYCDWEFAAQYGIDVLIRDFLTYTHMDVGGMPMFTCRGWDRLFRIQEPVYREFLLEFYATVAFDPTKPLNDRTAFPFRLGGVSRECSAIELAIRVGVYTIDETRTPHFHNFLSSCVVGTHEEYNENDFWAQLTGEVYVPSSARGSMIRSTTYRLLYRLIARSFSMMDPHYTGEAPKPSIGFSIVYGVESQRASGGYSDLGVTFRYSVSGILLVVDQGYYEDDGSL
ncbi:uncharacterized protein LOC111907237 [Lactuca sativa]|uniref:uncharacterized protein LOC111907237 n=1 Tax=Lactuca sativa TaxID=4236 RepID=UPI000CD89E7B|nr:uncharacterized protein LOC111907237 [Lactuca sativa]